MARKAALLALTALITGCSEAKTPAPPEPQPSATTAAAAPVAAVEAKPQLSACPKAEVVDEGLRGRTEPIPVPDIFGSIVAADMDHFAVATLDGGTVCVDTSWIDSVSSPKLSADKRFLSFEWGGYEAFGYLVVDRNGKGSVIETGNAPHLSPDGKLMASVDLSESGFGGLNAFAIWRVEPTGIKPVAHIEQGMPSGDWAMAGWQGDHCVNLSVLPSERQSGNIEDIEKLPRDPWFASEASGWKLSPGRCPRA